VPPLFALEPPVPPELVVPPWPWLPPVPVPDAVPLPQPIDKTGISARTATCVPHFVKVFTFRTG
jgi:hypothetical protein